MTKQYEAWCAVEEGLIHLQLIHFTKDDCILATLDYLGEEQPENDDDI